MTTRPARWQKRSPLDLHTAGASARPARISWQADWIPTRLDYTYRELGTKVTRTAAQRFTIERSAYAVDGVAAPDEASVNRRQRCGVVGGGE